ncbi:MAG: biopolymer transporter ExbD, partial [Polyangiales bacterium]
MGLARKKRGKVAPEMNVTPLVDVVLVLLIIFMVILPAAVSDLNLELAKIENPDEERENDPE